VRRSLVGVVVINGRVEDAPGGRAVLKVRSETLLRRAPAYVALGSAYVGALFGLVAILGTTGASNPISVFAVPSIAGVLLTVAVAVPVLVLATLRHAQRHKTWLLAYLRGFVIADR